MKKRGADAGALCCSAVGVSVLREKAKAPGKHQGWKQQEKFLEGLALEQALGRGVEFKPREGGMEGRTHCIIKGGTFSLHHDSEI